MVYPLRSTSKSQLVISYVGYRSETVSADGSAALNIKLVKETKELDEVIVIGYASFQTSWLVNKAATGFALNDTAVTTPKTTYTAAQIAAGKYTVYDIPKVYGSNGVPVQRKFCVSLKKFKDSTRTSIAEAQSARDAFVIRLAEMYLIAAEAEVNTGKLDSAAYYINIIRTRAANPGRVANMQVLPAQMTIDFILDERARELRPIPQSQLDAVTNKSVFTQNPGYQ